jgi:ATP-dependent DNA helicase DinG
VIEAEVHQQLREFLRHYGEASWPHHLTLARLVARALRLERSALLQVGGLSAYQGDYRLSYLVALLLWPEPAILVAPPGIQQRLLLSDLPRLQETLNLPKPIQVGDRWPHPDFRGLLITSPELWLADRLGEGDRFPPGIPTLVDDADNLELWLEDQLTTTLTPQDWHQLGLAYPHHRQRLGDIQVALTYAAFQHPPNPYHCYLLEPGECKLLQDLLTALEVDPGQGIMPVTWQRFWHHFTPPDHLLWFALDRPSGRITLHCAPVDCALRLARVWQQQPVVLIGAALDQQSNADIFRQRLGLHDLTCLKFSPPRQYEALRLYLPDHLPLPNTPQFQEHLQAEIRRLLVCVKPSRQGPTVILVNDLPLKEQLATALAAEFGSRVQLEQPLLEANTILVSSWCFWQQHRLALPVPDLLIVATLPLPSLENPMVAGRVAFHKRHRQDWFRLYLFPTAMAELERAIGPVRLNQGMVALLDSRIHRRSYGRQILAALSPSASTRSLNLNWE